MSIEPSLHYGDLSSDRFVFKRYDAYIRLIKAFLKDKKDVSVLDVGGYYSFLFRLKDTYEDFGEITHYEILDYDTSSIDLVKKAGAITSVMNFDFRVSSNRRFPQKI